MDLLDIAIVKQLAGGGGGSGTDNYNDLSNLPKINDTTLSGNKSSSALGLQSEINSDSKLASDLVDDTNQDNKFVTSTEKNTWNGKQNAIDADHKLSSDLVDDANHTNKFVTSTEKNTWNGKQNAIDADHKLSSDLVDDANKTNKFVTSTEKNTWNNKQNAIDSDHKLSSSLVSFTTAEAAALASGIDSSKVEQIGTNQTNILYAINTGAWNLCPAFEDSQSAYGMTVTSTRSGVTLTGTKNYADVFDFVLGTGKSTLKAGTYVFSGTASDAAYATHRLQFKFEDGTIITLDDGTTPKEQTFANDVVLTSVHLVLRYANGSSLNLALTPMVVAKQIWDTLGHDYQPPSVQNYDLTYLEAQDRAALVEEIDSGAKNCFVPDSLTTEVGGLTITRESDGTTIKINGTYTGSDYAYINIGHFVMPKAGTYFISAVCTKPMTGSTYYAYTNDNLLTLSGAGQPTSHNYTSIPATIPTVYIRVTPQQSFNNDTVKLLICTKPAFDVSKQFAPYRPIRDLVSYIDGVGGFKDYAHGGGIANVDLNAISTTSFTAYNNPTNLPTGLSGWCYVRTYVYDTSGALQELFMVQANPVSYFRIKSGGNWSAWIQTSTAS